MHGVDAVRIRAGRRRVGHRALVDGDALAGDRRLVDAAVAGDDEAVGRQAGIGLDDHDVAERELLHGDVDQGPATPHGRGPRREFGQRLDRPLRAPHGVMLEGMPEAEEKQQEGALRPLAERGCARCRHEHERVDLEPLHAQVVDRLARREPAAECIGPDVGGERNPRRHRREALE